MKSDSTLQSNASLQVLRSYNRAWDQMRHVTLERNVMKNADGSCLVTFGDTRVLCTATVEEGGIRHAPCVNQPSHQARAR